MKPSRELWPRLRESLPKVLGTFILTLLMTALASGDLCAEQIELARQVSRVLTKDAYVKPESVQVLVDLARESAKVTKPVSAADVVDYSFLDKARKELGITQP